MNNIKDNWLNKIIHLTTPLLLFIFSLGYILGFDPNNDPGGWGGLAIIGSVIISIFWILIILFVVLILNLFCKNRFSREIMKIVISILNIAILLKFDAFFKFEGIEFITIINILLVIINVIIVFLNKNEINKNIKTLPNNIIINTDKIKIPIKKLYNFFIGFSILILLIFAIFISPKLKNTKYNEEQQNTKYNNETLETQQNDIYDETIEIQQGTTYENKKIEIQEEFDSLLINNFISMNDFKLSDDYTTISDVEFLIINDNMPNNEIDFCNELVYSYNSIKIILKKYNYTSQIINFKFTNKNPFGNATSTFYQDSGYIRDAGSLYLIYLNSTPIQISK